MSGVILEEIERSLLNAIIEGDMSFDDLKGMGLCAEDFSSETHHLIFESMGRLHEKREPIDVLNLCNELDGTSRPNGRAWSSYITNVLRCSPSDRRHHISCQKNPRGFPTKETF